MAEPSDIVLIAATGAESLTDEIGGILGIPPAAIDAEDADGETHLRLPCNVRLRDTYVVACLGGAGVNRFFVELSLIVSGLRRASAARITAVLPYYAYGRQARKHTSRVPISAADVASLLEEMGVDGVLTLDLHKEEIAGFFSPRCHFASASCQPAAARYLHTQRQLRRPVVVAPHASGVTLAKAFFDSLAELHASGDGGSRFASPRAGAAPTLAMLLPHKASGSERRHLELIGEVRGQDAIIVDDIIDSGKTIARCSEALLEAGAARVFAVATHGIFSEESLRIIAVSDVTTVVVTNSVPFSVPRDHPVRRKLVVLSAAPVLAHQASHAKSLNTGTSGWEAGSGSYSQVAKLARLPPPSLDQMAATFPMTGSFFDQRRSRQLGRSSSSGVVSPLRERAQALHLRAYQEEIGVGGAEGNISDEAEMGSEGSRDADRDADLHADLEACMVDLASCSGPPRSAHDLASLSSG